MRYTQEPSKEAIIHPTDIEQSEVDLTRDF
jgi:hypothetical protein